MTAALQAEGVTAAPQAEGVTDALRAEGLTKQYGGRAVLDRLDLALAPGELVALVGPSGAGKTTLFRCLTRLVEPDAGRIAVFGRPLTGLRARRLVRERRELGLIFQQFNLIRRHSALDNVLAGRLGHVATWQVLLRRFPAADRQRAVAALDRVGLADRAGQRADSLSGGQQQRVAIARVLAQESRVVLADEPVASLDPDSAALILDLLRGIARERGIAVLCSLHQPQLARHFADRVLRLEQGRLVPDPAASPTA